MRFVHSLDDSVLGIVAGGVAALVATATALFSGHAYIERGGVPFESFHAGDSAAHSGVWSDGDTGSAAHASVPVGADPAPEGSLCEPILLREGDVDELNEQIDELLRDVKSGKAQRRR